MTKAAEIRKDDRVLMELRGGKRGAADPIAGDILVHRSCQRQYTNRRTLNSIQKTPKEVQHMVDPYDRAFEMIAEEVKDSHQWTRSTTDERCIGTIRSTVGGLWH